MIRDGEGDGDEGGDGGCAAKSGELEYRNLE